jgi:ABC-type Fe3+-hydroxamate transport system substrate-binding protein
MKLRHNDRPTAVMLAALAMSVTVGLAACGSSDASDVTVPTVSATEVTVPVTAAPTTTAAPETTVAAVPPSTEVSVATTDNVLIVTDAEVADLEKQLDEIDQLLAGVDSDLSQD